MSFDPKKVQRYDMVWKGRDYMQYQDLDESEHGDWVRAEDYDKLLSLLHDVSSEADPAGTLRELRLAQDTIKAQEKLIDELKLELARVKDQLDFERDLQG